MNSRSSSFSVPAPRLQQRPSFTSRLSFAISNAEQGEATAAPNVAENQIDEEIEEIKRYEVCAAACYTWSYLIGMITYWSIPGLYNNRFLYHHLAFRRAYSQSKLDWVQDAAKEQIRRKIRRKETAGFFERGGRAGWRYKLWESYDAAQGWIVVTLIGEHIYVAWRYKKLILEIGAAIGMNAAFLNIITEWLSDVKLGYCKTAFYLNESFCCWGEDNGRSPKFNGNHALMMTRLWWLGSMELPCSGQLRSLYSVCCTLYFPPPKFSGLTFIDHIRSNLCQPGQIVCTLRRWFRNIGDQMHHSWLRHEGLLGILDFGHQIDNPTLGDCLWAVGRQRRPECALCRMYRQCYL